MLEAPSERYLTAPPWSMDFIRLSDVSEIISVCQMFQKCNLFARHFRNSIHLLGVSEIQSVYEMFQKTPNINTHT
jgi:hypothetical protein